MPPEVSLVVVLKSVTKKIKIETKNSVARLRGRLTHRVLEGGHRGVRNFTSFLRFSEPFLKFFLSCSKTWWKFRIFLIFFLFWGGGKGEASEEAARGTGLNKKQTEGGGFPRRRRGRGKGAGGISVRRGGGVIFYFFEAEMPTKKMNLSTLRLN